MRRAVARTPLLVRLLALSALLATLLQAVPSIVAPSITPTTLTVNQPTAVSASCQISAAPDDPPVIQNGVNLVRLNSSGAAVSTIGVMQDAGSGLYSLSFNLTEPTAESFQLECTAAFKGLLQRIKSPPTIVNVVSGSGQGSIGTVTLAPNSIPRGTPNSVTITAPASGGTPEDGSVMLQRLDSSGRVLAILGTLHDDGLNGDPVAADGNYTLVTNFTEAIGGTVPLRVSATFSGAANHALSPVANLTVQPPFNPPPTVTISSPMNLGYLSLSPTTVSGTVSEPAATVVVNSIAAPVDSTGKFSATVPLAEGPNILTATATSSSGVAGTASIQVTLDTTPPHVTITSPLDQFVTTASSASIAGNVNDIVVGTVNSQQARVTVNGVASQVANRTFLAQNIPLSLGSNIIQAIAVDSAGNSATTQITIVRQAVQPGQITVVSGSNQTGTIGTALSAPLVVALTDSTGAPAANRQVLFSVTQNNGMLSTTAGTPAPSVLAMSDAQGRATVNWALGMRSGAGSDAVQAYSVGLNGTALFTATANQSTPGMIVIDTGNNQTGAVNQSLPKPFIAVVTDAGHNRLANVPVTFTAQQGGGSFGGLSTLTVTTDSDGRAAAMLTLGFQEGMSNNLVTADFPGNTGYPAAFNASGLGPGDPVKTVISGLVLDNTNQPIPGVAVRALLTHTFNSNPTSAQTAATAQTDATGHFSIYRAPVGYVKLFVDGSTATAPGNFPILEYDLVTVPGQINTVDRPIFLLPLKTGNKLCVDATTGGGTLTIPEAPGFSLTFSPGQVTFPGGSKQGCVSVTVVHPDKVPMTPGFGQQPRFIVTIQPAGAVFNPPAPITIPNVDGLQPREVTEMYSYDHDISSFVAIGTGTVSDDGRVIRSNAGVGVLKAGWHCGGNPTAAGAAAECGPCAYCDGTNCQPDKTKTSHTCQNPCLDGGQGTCDANGYCSGTKKPDGTGCGNGGVCQNGNCVLGSGPGPHCTAVCNSGNPCIDDSCSNNQCIATANQRCDNACTGKPDHTSCTVGNLTGVCEGGSCDLCQSLGTGASCTLPGGRVGMCDSSGRCNDCQGVSLAGQCIKIGDITFQNPSMSEPKAIDESYKFMGVFVGGSTNFSFETDPPGTSIPSSELRWSGISFGDTQVIAATFTVPADQSEDLQAGATSRTARARILNQPSGSDQYTYVAIHPIDSAIALAHNLIGADDSTLEPSIWAAEEFNTNPTDYQSARSLHNGLGDAARHTYWSCLLALYTNTNYALGLTTAHEVSSPGPATETVMDLSNNLVGTSLATALNGSSPDNGACRSAVLSAITRGAATYMDECYGTCTDTAGKALLQPTDK